jgi:O-6-methylguanine DNA methyltransferase
MDVQWTTYSSILGPLALVECRDGPLVVEFPRRAAHLRWIERITERRGPVRVAHGPCPVTSQWLNRYFAGHPDPLPWPDWLPEWLPPTPIQEAVWRAICAIPVGETRTYGEIAREARQHPRVTGQATGSNHLAILIPCHRVVGRGGALVGYGGGVQRKRRLLSHELRVAGLSLR